MSNAKIKFYTSSYPNLYGDPLQKIMWIEGNKEFFILNANSYNNDPKTLDGIGLIEGDLDKLTEEKYKEIRNNILIINKNNVEKYKKALKHKKLNVYSLENDKENNAFIVYQSNNEEEKEITDWFKVKTSNFLKDKKYRLKTGFLIDSLIEGNGEGYSVKVIIKNISESKIVLSGINDWKIKENNSKRKDPEVVLYLRNGWDVFNFNLSSSNYIVEEKSILDRITLEAKSEKTLKFFIKKSEFDHVKDYLIKNPNAKLDSGLIVNLDIYEPSIISGWFYYSTKSKKIN